jgi:hypothetical protein
VTPADLLSRCRTFGIELTAGRDGSLLWEAGSDPPAELLAALAERKAELLGLLTTWPDPDAAELVAWFATFPWPREPFALAPFRRVEDPELFCRTLAEDIGRGPGGPHVHHGRVIADLRELHQLFGWRPVAAEVAGLGSGAEEG